MKKENGHFARRPEADVSEMKSDAWDLQKGAAGQRGKSCGLARFFGILAGGMIWILGLLITIEILFSLFF